MGEYDPSRTYALASLRYALCDPRGQPLSIHGSPDSALAAFVKKRGLDIDPENRRAAFSMLLKHKYSIRGATAWCRVEPYQITKLPAIRKPTKRVRLR